MPPQIQPTGHRLLSISILGLIISIAAIGLPLALVSEVFWALRLLVFSVGIVLTVWAYHRGPRELLISPLLILAMVQITFFSILPIFFETSSGILNYGVEIHNMVQAALRGDGDRLIVQSAALCLALAAFAGSFPQQKVRAAYFRQEAWGFCLGGIGSIVLAMTAFYKLRGLGAEYEILRSRLIDDIQVALPPLLALASAAVTYISAHSQNTLRRILSMGIVVSAMAAQVVIGSPKLAIITTVGCLVLFLSVAPRNKKFIVTFSLLTLLLPFAGLMGMSVLRYQDITIGVQSIATVPAALERVFTAKVVNRQGVTIYCFNKIVERKLYAQPERSPYYFLAGLIPGYFWPDKPSLSIGEEIATEYCGHELNPSNPDTAVGTLLGEPIMRAGFAGLIVAEVVLLGGLLGLTWLGLRGGLGAIYVAALAPWLVDFDQHFTMYIANAVKVSFFMAPGILLLMRYRLYVDKQDGA